MTTNYETIKPETMTDEQLLASLPLVSLSQTSQEPASDASIIKDVKSTTNPKKTAHKPFKREKRILDISSGLLSIKADITKLSNPQAWTLKSFLKNNQYNDAVNYLASFTSNERLGSSWRVQDMKGKLCAPNRTDALKDRQKGFYVSLYQKLLRNDSQHGAAHIASGDAVGVEIECFIKADGFNDAARKLRAELSALKVKRAYVKSDGSLSPSEDWEDSDAEYEDCGECDDCDEGEECQNRRRADNSWQGIELVVMYNAKDKENLVKACRALKNLGARVNKTCGLHVHLDARDVSGVDTRASRLASCLKEILVPMVPKSRRANRYCRLGVSGNDRSGDRYYAINKTSYGKHGTLEVRLHSGTIDAKKIHNWALILRAAQEKSRGYTFKDTDSQYDKINYFCDKSGLDGEIKNYIINRQREFSPELFGLSQEAQEESETNESPF